MTIAAVVLLGGIVWTALAREPAWVGLVLCVTGVAALFAAIRK